MKNFLVTLKHTAWFCSSVVDAGELLGTRAGGGSDGGGAGWE